jgi:hypothetical protein
MFPRFRHLSSSASHEHAKFRRSPWKSGAKGSQTHWDWTYLDVFRQLINAFRDLCFFHLAAD